MKSSGSGLLKLAKRLKIPPCKLLELKKLAELSRKTTPSYLYKDILNARSKAIRMLLGFRHGVSNVSVRKGKGTAHFWLYISIKLQENRPVDTAELQRQRNEIQKETISLIGETGIHLSKYLSDSGPEDKWHDCLIIDIQYAA